MKNKSNCRIGVAKKKCRCLMVCDVMITEDCSIHRSRRNPEVKKLKKEVILKQTVT